MSGSATLGNSFIPKISPLVTARILSRLSTDGLTNLCLLWSTIPQTQPKSSKLELEELDLTPSEFIKEYKNYIIRFKKSKNPVKRRLIDRILSDYYKLGLNLLQYAQIEVQLLVEKPFNFFWQYSKLINSKDEEQILNLKDPQSFLEILLKELSKFYLNHIYISRHPHYPLVIIRIQLFDLVTEAHIAQLRKLTSGNTIISRKSIFLALPINSSNIIHSYQSDFQYKNDTTLNIVLQAVEFALSQALERQVRLQIDTNQQPIRSLESLHILKGNSRFSESLGAWAPYADGSIDISPFDDVKLHQTLVKHSYKIDTGDDRRKLIARLRFKGTVKDLQSEDLFEDVDVNRKRRKVIDYSEDANEDEDGIVGRHVDKNEYSSITPIQFVEFEIRNEFENFKPNIKLKFVGNDIYAGLHELCDLKIADPETIPAWLTGEEKADSGIIEDGTFIKYESSYNNNGALI